VPTVAVATNKLELDLARLESLAGGLVAGRGGWLQLRPRVNRELAPVVRDMMMLADLLGRRRSLLFVEQSGFGRLNPLLAGPNPYRLELGIRDTFRNLFEKLKRAFGFTQQAENRLSLEYQIRAVRLLTDVSAEVENEIRLAIQTANQQRLSPAERVAYVAATFDRLNLSPKHPGTIQTIVNTQSQIAYYAGRWHADQVSEMRELLWGYRYVTAGDERVRPNHRAVDGTVLPKDDPFWLIWWPPNGWNCRCQVVPIFDSDGGGSNSAYNPSPLSDGIRPDRGFDRNIGLLIKSRA
jgi:SPP1 gp7 family putative phage head morphogenesis protein